MVQKKKYLYVQVETKNIIHAEFNHTRDWSRFDNSITAAGTNGCACMRRAAVKKVE